MNDAIAAFKHACPGRQRTDCDPGYQGWQCSTEQLPIESEQIPIEQPQNLTDTTTATAHDLSTLNIQAENPSQSSGSGWAIENSNPGFTGTGYIVWRGEDHFRADTNTPPIGVQSYDFTIHQPGTYEFTARVQARVSNTNAAVNDENDAWMRFTSGKPTPGVPGNSAKWTKFFVSGADESWKTYTHGEQYDPSFFTPIKRDLTAGIHRVLVGGRSAGFAIDSVGLKLVVESNGSPIFTNQDPPNQAEQSPVSTPQQPQMPSPSLTQATACTTEGANLRDTINQFDLYCSGVTRKACDKIGMGLWQCSSEAI